MITYFLNCSMNCPGKIKNDFYLKKMINNDLKLLIFIKNQLENLLSEEFTIFNYKNIKT